MDINFELYKIFYYAAKAENFSVAAEQLFITQSAVSQAIKNLETKLGISLFFRKTRHLTLTHEGELLYSHISQAFNFIKTAENKLSEIQLLDAGEIRVGASDTVCKYYLLPYLEKFTHLYPKIKIRVINRTSSQLTESLHRGLIDLAIITLPTADKTVKINQLVSVEDILVASPKFGELQAKKVDWSELNKYPLLMLERSSATRRNFDRYLGQKGVVLAPELELESVDLLVEFAKIGLGIGFVLKESAQNALQSGELFEVETNEKLPLRQLGAATIENVPLSQAALKFMSLLA